MAGGVRWIPTRGRPTVDDRRHEPPAIRERADAVDGRRMTRCLRCKNGKMPERIMVTIQTVHVVPTDYQVVLSCPWCTNRLTRTSARRVNHATMKVFKYE